MDGGKQVQDLALLFKKLFHDDIQTLLSMDKLWQKRRAPVPVDEHTEFPAQQSAGSDAHKLVEQQLWTAAECRERFLQRLGTWPVCRRDIILAE